jgi:hypothetical protein
MMDDVAEAAVDRGMKEIERKQIRLDLITNEEAVTLASSLIKEIGPDHARAVAEVLRNGWSAGCWRILAEMRRELGVI